MTDPVPKPSSWSRFFFYLKRVNTLLFFIVLVVLAYLLIVDSYRSYSYENEFSSGESGFDKNNENIEGDLIETSDGQVVAYTLEPLDKGQPDMAGANVSFTLMETGQSRTVLPDSSEQLVLNWESLVAQSSGAQAYSVLAGSEQDYQTGELDWILGRFSDLEQKVMIRRARYIDAPRMIDENTLSVIVWPTQETAEYWLVAIDSFSVVHKRPVALPKPNSLKLEDELDTAAEALVEAAEETAREMNQ